MVFAVLSASGFFLFFFYSSPFFSRKESLNPFFPAFTPVYLVMVCLEHGMHLRDCAIPIAAENTACLRKRHLRPPKENERSDTALGRPRPVFWKGGGGREPGEKSRNRDGRPVPRTYVDDAHLRQQRQIAHLTQTKRWHAEFPGLQKAGFCHLVCVMHERSPAQPVGSRRSRC